MMGLMVEKMRQGRTQCLLEYLATGVLVFQHPFKITRPGHKAENPLILGLPSGPEFREAVMQDLAQPFGLRSVAGEPPHPDIIGNQQMVQRAVDTAEEQAEWLLARLI